MPDNPVIDLAIKRFKFASDAEAENRKAMKSDMEFYVSDQWDGDIKKARANRPCLTINRLPGFTRQITNGLRQSMPSLVVIPSNDGTEEVAEVMNGIIRHIQEASQASIAYSTANNSQVIAGLGFFRLVTEYANDTSFDKDIKIKRIKNALTVYVDPAAIEPDYSDAMYMFITSDITHAEFKRQYPDKEVVNNDELTSQGDEIREWMTAEKSSMRIAEYFTVEEKDDKEIYRLPDGSVTEEKPKSGEYDTRTIKTRYVKWRKISGVEVLEETDWPGKYIPVIPVMGEDIDVDGKRIIKGMVRDAKDPQRMYNYWSSAQTETIALAPKAPFIIAEGQIEGYEAQWDSANTKNWSSLTYKPQSVNGTLIGAPQRNQAEPPVQAMVQAMKQAGDDMKAVTGIYDASLGAKSNEVSGTAIKARTLQGDVANYHYNDNFGASLLYLGRQLVDLIPKIYDSARVVRILGEDGTSEYKPINQATDEKDKDGIAKIYDLTTGEYDIVLDVGPSYKTKREEDAANMTTLLSSNPELWKVAGDIFVKAMDWPDAQQLSERLKKMLPPELQESDPNEEIPLPVKQKLDQSSQLIEQLTQTVHKLQDQIDTKTLELESKERIAYSKNETDLVIKSMGMQGDANHELMVAEFKHIADEQARVHGASMQQDANIQAQTMQQSTQDHAADMQQQATMQNNVDNTNTSMVP